MNFCGFFFCGEMTMDEAGQRASQLLRERIAREIFFWKATAVGRENRREERAILTDIASNHDMPFCARCTGKRGGELSIMALCKSPECFRCVFWRIWALTHSASCKACCMGVQAAKKRADMQGRM